MFMDFQRVAVEMRFPVSYPLGFKETNESHLLYGSAISYLLTANRFPQRFFLVQTKLEPEFLD